MKRSIIIILGLYIASCGTPVKMDRSSKSDESARQGVGIGIGTSISDKLHNVCIFTKNFSLYGDRINVTTFCLPNFKCPDVPPPGSDFPSWEIKIVPCEKQ